MASFLLKFLVQSGAKGRRGENIDFALAQKRDNIVGTFGFLFFSLQGLPEGSRLPTDPGMPFPYWKNDYFVTHMSFRYTVSLQIKKNQLKSGRDG